MQRTPPAPADEKGTTKGSPRFRRGDLVLFDSDQHRANYPEVCWPRVGIVLRLTGNEKGVIMWETGEVVHRVWLVEDGAVKRL